MDLTDITGWLTLALDLDDLETALSYFSTS
jgi:hypothetical protein